MLPTHGWFVHASSGEVRGYSAFVDERHVDYLWVRDGIELADGRGEAIRLGNVTTTDLTVRLADGRTLEEGPDGAMRWVP